MFPLELICCLQLELKFLIFVLFQLVIHEVCSFNPKLLITNCPFEYKLVEVVQWNAAFFFPFDLFVAIIRLYSIPPQFYSYKNSPHFVKCNAKCNAATKDRVLGEVMHLHTSIT